jgi:hypothetical protein
MREGFTAILEWTVAIDSATDRPLLTDARSARRLCSPQWRHQLTHRMGENDVGLRNLFS